MHRSDRIAAVHCPSPVPGSMRVGRYSGRSAQALVLATQTMTRVSPSTRSAGTKSTFVRSRDIHSSRWRPVSSPGRRHSWRRAKRNLLPCFARRAICGVFRPPPPACRGVWVTIWSSGGTVIRVPSASTKVLGVIGIAALL